MRIVDNRELGMCAFQCLRSIGQVFEYAGEIYMTIEKVRNDSTNHYNAVCLNDGELYYFDIESVLPLGDVTLEIN